MKTWTDFERNLKSSFAGGHHDDGKLEAYYHGMATVCHVLDASYPSGPDAMKHAQEALTALQYMADRDNWDEETGMLKRPGGGRQEGIVLYSHLVYPWAFAAQFVG